MQFTAILAVAAAAPVVLAAYAKESPAAVPSPAGYYANDAPAPAVTVIATPAGYGDEQAAPVATATKVAAGYYAGEETPAADATPDCTDEQIEEPILSAGARSSVGAAAVVAAVVALFF